MNLVQSGLGKMNRITGKDLVGAEGITIVSDATWSTLDWEQRRVLLSKSHIHVRSSQSKRGKNNLGIKNPFSSEPGSRGRPLGHLVDITMKRQCHGKQLKCLDFLR